MDLGERVKSNLDYGKKLVRSGLEGAADGRNAYLEGTPLSPFLSEAARSAWNPAVVGACIGLLGSYMGRRNRSTNRAVVLAALGAIVGFGAGFTWTSRHLATSIGHEAAKRVNAVRDERWLERNPINYA